ncbi:MAG: DUF721 domain-containing protein [Tannerella sp.]|jgi:predicted nucleic acid-binding Zn ribbon protein|nr:DUF721 domain-containing protein [Tannerella sp.]
MKRTNAKSMGELLQHFYEEHPQIRQKLMEVSVQRAWHEMLGRTVSHATRDLYIKDRTLYVSLNSSVIRNELLMHQEKIVAKLNERAGEEVIRRMVIR